MQITVNEQYEQQPAQTLSEWQAGFGGQAEFVRVENVVQAVVDMMGEPTIMGEYDTDSQVCTMCV